MCSATDAGWSNRKSNQLINEAYMSSDTILSDERLDPLTRQFLSMRPEDPEFINTRDREELIAFFNTDPIQAMMDEKIVGMELYDNESVAPSTGLQVEEFEYQSTPDNNIVKGHFTRPRNQETVACIYYLHGGGMAVFSCFHGMYKAWARTLAAQGVGVCMIDFRNSLLPSSSSEVAAFPAGMNDCVAGFEWFREQHERFGIDPSRIVIAGESGGGNLAISTAMTLNAQGKSDLFKGVYSLCPILGGKYPDSRFPSTVENEGIVLSLHCNIWTVAYGLEAYENENPFAWPCFASEKELAGLPPVVINLNECDPLRDEGLYFYRLLNKAGVRSRCREIKGTIHGSELLLLPLRRDISMDTVRDLVAFCKED